MKIQRKYPTLTPAALDQSALHMFDALRNREDATANFRSLDAGVRLDIAMSVAVSVDPLTQRSPPTLKSVVTTPKGSCWELGTSPGYL